MTESDEEFLKRVSGFEPTANGWHPIQPETLSRLLALARRGITADKEITALRAKLDHYTAVAEKLSDENTGLRYDIENASAKLEKAREVLRLWEQACFIDATMEGPHVRVSPIRAKAAWVATAAFIEDDQR